MLTVKLNNSLLGIQMKQICQHCYKRLLVHLAGVRFTPGTSLKLGLEAHSEFKHSTRKFYKVSTLQSLEKKTSTLFNHTDSSQPSEWDSPFKLPEPELDWTFLLNRKNTELIANNILSRKGVGDIHKVISLSEQLDKEQNEMDRERLRQELITEALDIPNMSHSSTIIGDETAARVIEVVGTKKEFDFTPRNVSEIAGKGLKMLRDERLTFSTGAKTYYLEDGLARLEKALVSFTLDRLLKKRPEKVTTAVSNSYKLTIWDSGTALEDLHLYKSGIGLPRGFELVSVPDLLYSGVIDSCGFKTSSDRTQVYHLHPHCLNGACLAGTAEMSLAGYFMNEVIPYDQLPKRMVAVSRCYRAEAQEKAVEKGLYRVHHFTKVEMFGLSSCESGSESEDLLHEMLSIEQELFSALGLHFRVLDMPTQELGAPAQRKFDIEAWMYGKNIWGEISSCSNCTDYQSRRLNIKYTAPSGELRHVHTVNGTACAVPRLITAILEQNQCKKRRLDLPEVLWPYLDGQKGFTAEWKRSSYSFIMTLSKV